MAVPTITKTGSGSSKASGTALAITVSTTAYALGDYVVCGFSMDPASGAVSFAKTAGTATVGSWTTVGDVANGSGTSGVRTVLAYAKVTVAGTITTITVTHPTATAKAGETFNVNGADGTTPVAAKATSTTAGVIFALSPLPATGVDYAGLAFAGIELPAGTTALIAPFQYDDSVAGSNQAFSFVAGDSTSVGTTGAGAASNISIGYGYSTNSALPSTTTAIYGSPVFTSASASTQANVSALWQPPAVAATSLVFDERRVRRNSLLRR